MQFKLKTRKTISGLTLNNRYSILTLNNESSRLTGIRDTYNKHSLNRLKFRNYSVSFGGLGVRAPLIAPLVNGVIGTRHFYSTTTNSSDTFDSTTPETTSSATSDNDYPTVLSLKPLVPRLESHYEKVLIEDLILLNYSHYDITSIKFKNLIQQDNLILNPKTRKLSDLFTKTLNQLETKPLQKQTPFTEILPTIHNNTNPYSVSTVNPPREYDRGFKRFVKNPIDYTSIKKKDYYSNLEKIALEREEQIRNDTFLAGVPTCLSKLVSITLSLSIPDANSNKNSLYSAMLSLQSISGRRPDPIIATRGDASRRIRAGMTIGCNVTLDATESYHFLDKTIQCVLPRIREWKGVDPKGDGKGSITFMIPASNVGSYPDIEAHFDRFPKLFDTEVTIKTTAKNDKEAILLLSGFQLVFQDKIQVDETEEVVVDDPWAAIKAAKSSEERRALFEQMTLDRRNKREAQKEQNE